MFRPSLLVSRAVSQLSRRPQSQAVFRRMFATPQGQASFDLEKAFAKGTEAMNLAVRTKNEDGSISYRPSGTGENPNEWTTRRTLGALFFGSGAILTFCLFIWQIKRREWKKNLLDYREGQMRKVCDWLWNLFCIYIVLFSVSHDIIYMFPS